LVRETTCFNMNFSLWLPHYAPRPSASGFFKPPKVSIVKCALLR